VAVWIIIGIGIGLFGVPLLGSLLLLALLSTLFITTNLSNLPMQSLLVKLGYVLSGVIPYLDEGDPEIVYFKRLR